MVKAYRESVTIPTYEIGQAEKNPIFLEKRVYQGSSGVVYPYPVIEKIADKPVPHVWQVVWLENEYIKVMILPELGGRIQMAFDKIKQRHFVYYNSVIKPALVGLTGPWISGGIEFNWPQHHRPSTYLPVDSRIEEHADGSVTVWVNEHERMFHQQGSAAFTLHPKCAFLEIKGRLYNPTDVPQTFLWWANPAVHVNDAYQSVFPPDIHAVFDHGKRAVSSFPIATGTYYKMDYSAGVDISNYRNIPVPTSYMAVNSKYDFEGGYENDTQGGMLHVASHHFSPGKKQWTWGNGDFGRAWDRNLTDNDGPYIELMAGVYTENQPDFSWLMPYEEKTFTQYFMPYRELGIVKQASRDIVMNIQGNIILLYATSPQRIRVQAFSNQQVCYDAWHDISPEQVLRLTATDEPDRVVINKTLYEEEREVLCWEAEQDTIRPIPDAAEAALPPQQVKTNDQLYLTGLHIEQYRHATFVATDYYEEALRRDPDDIRCLNAMGLWYIRKARFAQAETYLRRAVKLWQKRNPNPYDGEPIYNLAVALKYQERYSEAYELFWKASWNKAWADAAYLEAAKISLRYGRWDDALDELNRALTFGAHNSLAMGLKVATLRHMHRMEEALAVAEEALALDSFNYIALYEKGLLTQQGQNELKAILHGMSNNYDTLALCYANAGLMEEAYSVWQMAIENHAATPMTCYYLGRTAEAEAMDSAYCFPNRAEEAVILQKTLNIKVLPKAAYYLGCLYYDKRQYDLAQTYWEQSSQADASFPTVWRNLALVYYNQRGLKDKALRCMERAWQLDTTDARVLMEYDQLRKRLQHPFADRLALLNQYRALVDKRDDLLLEYITLLNLTGCYTEAADLLDNHLFHPWEGGEGKVPAQYQLSRVERAKQMMSHSRYQEAVPLLEQCLVYPHHLGEGKLQGAQDNDFLYFLGQCYHALGEEAQAAAAWEKAILGPQEPAAALYYNDAKPDKIFFQGLALRALGREDEARGRFYRLLNYGKQHLFDHVTMDYFAVSLPDLQIWNGSLDDTNRIHCLYLLALGSLGLGDRAKATTYLSQAEQMDANHLGLYALRTYLESTLS